MASEAYDRALQFDKSNASTQTKLEMIKELFGNNSRGGKTTIASRNVVTGIVSAQKPSEVIASMPNTPTTTPVAAAKPVPAVTPAPSKLVAPVAAPVAEKSKQVTAEKSSGNASEEAVKTIHEWAAAWSAKNSKKYLSFYAKEFKTPDGESRKAWEAQRQERIAKPKTIHVEVKDVKIKLVNESHATAYFKQFYSASHLHTSASKTMELVKSNGKWLIAEERAAGK
jgi:hypothetical protein